MWFIGIDQAWTDGKPSGFARLEGGRRGVRLAEAPTSLPDVQSLMSAVSDSGDAVVAVDAPLVITNERGQRPCEHQVSIRFARFHAGAHSSNLSMRPNPPSLALARSLANGGFRHFLEGGNRLMLEVYPHPATIVLFNRLTIFRYKKGNLAVKRAGLVEFREALGRLSESEPALLSSSPLTQLLGKSLAPLGGTELKAHEDQLDAVFCAYLAAYAHCWRHARIEFIGHRDTGEIMVPTHTMLGRRWPDA